MTMQDQFTLIDEIVNEKEVEYAERQAVFAQQVRTKCFYVIPIYAGQ